MKKIMISVLFFMILGVKQGVVQAADVYACEYEGYEVYVDSNSIMGYRASGQMMVHRIKFVVDGVQRHFAVGKFIYNRNHGIWYGNLFIDGNSMWQLYDYPIESDALTYGIFEAAYQYLP